MANGFIPVAGTSANLQSYRNTIGGQPVDSEAITPTGPDGAPFSQANPQFYAPANETGTWGYKGGTSGTPAIPAGAKVLQITAISITGTGTIQINGGDSIPVPTGAGLTLEPKGNLIAPTIVFTGTQSYLVEFVQ